MLTFKQKRCIMYLCSSVVRACSLDHSVGSTRRKPMNFENKSGGTVAACIAIAFVVVVFFVMPTALLESLFAR